MSVMTKKKPLSSSQSSFPSRKGYKGTYLPKDLYFELDKYAAAEDRSAAFLVKRAVERLLIELRKSGPPGPSLRKQKNPVED